MEIPLVIKSLGGATLTGTITQVTAYFILWYTKNPLITILWIEVFGNVISYIVQSYIHGYKRVVGGMILRWGIELSLSLFLGVKTFQYIDNLKKIKELKKSLKGWKLDILNYSLITTAVMIVYFAWSFVMRRDYIFIYRNEGDSNINDIVLLLMSALIIALDQYLTKKNKINNKIDDKHLKIS